MDAPRKFRTTNWALVNSATSELQPDRLEALGKLFQDYTPALTEFLERFFRLSPEHATDKVQDFVSDRILAGNLLKRANQSKGRFRTFLLTSIRSYMADQFRAANSQKRRPPNGFVPLNEFDSDSLTPSPSHEEQTVFNEVFARQLIAEAVRRTHIHCQNTQQLDSWEILFARILGPLFENLPRSDYSSLIEVLNIPSIALAQRKLTTAKRIFRRQFRAVVSDYVATDRETEEEITFLREFLHDNLHNFDD